MPAWACGSATSGARPDDDGAVSPPYCVLCPLARTARLVERLHSAKWRGFLFALQ
jgi:hypothetical protein